MTQDEIIRMAEEAGLAFGSDEYPDIWQTYMNVGREEIERFAALVAAHEREKQVEQEPVSASFEDKKKSFAALKKEVKAPDDMWTVADGINFFGFFSHGWDAARKFYAAPQPVKQEPVAFADKYGNVMKAKEKLASTNVMTNWYDRPLYEKVGFDADLYSVAGKLALELECLLLDTKDLSVVSKWWDSAHDALEQWRSIKDAAPVRTKDLTDDEIYDVADKYNFGFPLDVARAVISADREKNK